MLFFVYGVANSCTNLTEIKRPEHALKLFLRFAITRGLGVYGIRRAFELAGAKTLLLTVEEIDDYNAALFMKIFYQYYKKSRNAMQSYQETQLYLSDYQNGIKELIQF